MEANMVTQEALSYIHPLKIKGKDRREAQKRNYQKRAWKYEN